MQKAMKNKIKPLKYTLALMFQVSGKRCVVPCEPDIVMLPYDYAEIIAIPDCTGAFFHIDCK